MIPFRPRKAKRNKLSLAKALRAGKSQPYVSPAEDAETDADELVLRKVRRRRGIYLLPNAFTTAALFCGFYAIVMAMNLKFDYASIAIFVAMVLDSLDGRVARMTNTQSEFGAQYDSLSDMVSFGAAPALVVYEWSLRGMGKLGWLAAFVYCAGGALRLARFNTNIAVVDKRYFQGLPSPAAAALVAGFVWLMDDLRFAGTDLSWVSWIITLYAGITMVTNVPFYSFKDINFRKPVPFIAALLLVLMLVAITSDPSKVLFSLFVLYGLSGYAIYLWRLSKGHPVSIVQTETEHDEKEG
ncbi:CDP-diacylglycerol--serine O-phosphatidyltransferase [Herbaspirillum sp. RTI4]|uniref:CDP-diacylglycerol--serine O-phosphatidyltransferase n=1 Tax=Herbaspirillum sp. RTI4 TaxID=3048640 RepID=UPI002AB459FE|nr:CDP-diacylglycerol--serine O-phosphatidyltransferase [Herbaspirillum sp. RTI4]MDY7578458.1 CDP-diacylglycerol--serine O-phosphatidyltransferase [Herbaspirillum sp. RTI4]MEA9981513.1 CDP-diacylglycerol--serine O-phosphatidyltransferase [Herbaspirillum sp. RTI4]